MATSLSGRPSTSWTRPAILAPAQADPAMKSSPQRTEVRRTSNTLRPPDSESVGTNFYLGPIGLFSLHPAAILRFGIARTALPETEARCRTLPASSLLSDLLVSNSWRHNENGIVPA